MILELGYFSLILAVVVSLVTGALGMAGGQRGQTHWMAWARHGTLALWLLTGLSFLCLMFAFYTNDFSVLYVAQHSNTQLPSVYRMAALWGGHEGSLLLWVVMLSTWMMAVLLLSCQLPQAMVSYVLGVMALLAFGLLMLMVLTSNPFVRLNNVPDNGRDLHPLLQDPWLVLHPPLLYMGYVGMSIPFASAVAALALGSMNAVWTRSWTLTAWVCLTLGIASGSWWAYRELGWGGWWFWDPVENASLLPWLVSTALIHSLAVTEKRGLFKSWTLFLALMAFSLCLLGTFLVRSGVLTSVHAFATDPRRGAFILLLLAVVGSALVLFARRADTMRCDGAISYVSRETFLLMSTVLFTTAAATVLLGTLYPLVMDVFHFGKLSVGHPYFNHVLTPILMSILFVMVVGSCAHWHNDSVARLTLRLRLVGGVAITVGCTAPFFAGHWSALVALALSLSAWIVLASLLQLWCQFKTMPLSLWGMHLAHIGVAVGVVGLTMVRAYETEKHVRMAVGDTVSVGGYTLRFTGVHRSSGPNYSADVGTLELRQGDTIPGTMMHPEKRFYFSSALHMTEAAIDNGWIGDIYVSLGEKLDNSHPPAWAVRVHYKPLMNWIWGGGLLMAIGGALAAWDKRYRTSDRA